MTLMAPTDLGGPKSEKIYGWSVAYRSMLPDITDVHNYGCRVAAKSNEGKAQRLSERGETFERGTHSVHYVGSWDMPQDQVIDVTSLYYTITVEPNRTKGLDEHCRIRIDVKDPAGQTVDDLANDRTEIIWQLYDILCSFAPGICKCDEDIKDSLQPIQRRLIEGPYEERQGSY